MSEELSQILAFIDSIPEKMCSHPQPQFLYELSKKTAGKGEIVEIGTCAGKSTIALAFAQKEKKGKKINTVDIREHPKMRDYLSQAEVKEYVNCIIGRSFLVAKKWNDPIELLWIDGDHRYNGIVSDIKSWSKFVIEGGIIAFHDYPGFDGVNDTSKAVLKCLLSKPDNWRVIADREAGTIIAFEKCTKPERGGLVTRFRKKKQWILMNLRWYKDEFLARLIN